METFSFNIATPCHENWNAMSPETQGRFCAACSKCVVDLTDKKPAEIKSLYDAHQGDMCGRMRVSQLARKPKPALPRLQFPVQTLRRMQRFALALLFAGGLMLGVPGKALAQAQVEVKMGKIAPMPTNHVGGIVRGESGERIANASLTLTDDEGNILAETRSDKQGAYSFDGRWYGAYQVHALAEDGSSAFIDIRFGRGSILKENITIRESEPEPFLMGDVMYIEPEPEPVPMTEPALEPLLEIDFIDRPCKCDHDPEGLPHALPPLTSIIQAAEAPSPSEADAIPAQGSVLEPGNKAQIELDGFGVTVYPNPTNDRVYVTAESVSEGELQITVSDLEGRRMGEQTWRPNLQPVQMIDIGHYASGVYLITVSQPAGKASTTRIVKQ